jgi:hypothetical protein
LAEATAPSRKTRIAVRRDVIVSAVMVSSAWLQGITSLQ